VNKKRLGKGLEALIPKDEAIGGNDEINEIPLDKIKPNPLQPRNEFKMEKLEELADTIREYGIIQPIIVQKEKDDYILVAGERRFRAAKIAGLKTIPAIIKEYEKRQLMEITLVENLQREDLNPIEEAKAYKRLVEEFALSQEEIGKKLGRSRSAITNSIRLLSLCDEVKNLLIEGGLTVGQARPLLALEKEEDQLNFANRIIKNKMTARQVEDQIKEYKNKKNKEQFKVEEEVLEIENNKKLKEYYIKDLEDNLRKAYGTKVSIKNGAHEGKVTLFYYGDEDLERLISLLLDREEESVK
jgi:ParB family chromosome partitioning protein